MVGGNVRNTKKNGIKGAARLLINPYQSYTVVSSSIIN